MSINHFQNFVVNASSVFKDRYDYSKSGYVNSYTPIILHCTEHGEFTVKPRHHISRKQGCPKCDCDSSRYTKNRTTEFDVFVKRAKIQHGNKYVYLPENFAKMRAIATIICPKHGEFKQEAKYHVKSKVGCKECYFENKKGLGSGAYSDDYFIRYPDRINKTSNLYFVKLKLVDGTTCLKIGVTQYQAIKSRFSRRTVYESFVELANLRLPLREAVLKEREILKDLKNYRIETDNRFAGYTECFRIDPEVIGVVSTHLGINISMPSES